MGEAKGGVVVLGSTSAIARAVAQRYAEEGRPVVVAARDRTENEAIASDIHVRCEAPCTPIYWDAEDFDSADGFVDACTEALGGLPEGVVLCSGYMEAQERAQTEWAVALRTINVNFTGAVAVLGVFANRFAERGSGFIVGVSSVAGDRGRQSNYLYGSAKAGFTTYLEGLRNRLYHQGVHVLTVKPGFVDTKMTWGQVPFAADPHAVANSIVKAQQRGRNVVYTPAMWRYIMLILRHIPEAVFKRLSM